MRYTGWRKMRGDTAERPDLLDLGKKLLGYLSEQRRLSGNTTMSIQRKLPDGSIVRARFVGDLPIIEVKAGPKPVEPVDQGLLTEGIVVKPRNFGTAAAGDGGDVYGAYPEVLLRGKGSVPTWKSQYYDETNTPPAVVGAKHYKRNLRMDEVWPAGLKLSGNVDWRNKDESLAITYHGETTRGLTFLSAYYRVFHNGEELYLSPYILEAACLRVEGKDLYLLWIAGTTVPTLYRAKLKPHPSLLWWESGVKLPLSMCPRLAPVTAPDVEVLSVLSLPQFTYQRWTVFSAIQDGQFVFNQAGTEARRIMVHLNAAPPFAYVALESVVSVPEMLADAVTTQETTLGSLLLERTTNYTLESTRAASYLDADMEFGDNPFTSPILRRPYFGIGAYFSPGNPYDPQAPIVFIRKQVMTITDTIIGDASLPIAVDFQDNVPVYLRWKPALRNSTLDWNSTLGELHTASGDGVTTNHRETTDKLLSSTCSMTASCVFSQGRIWATDKDGVDWLDIRIDASSNAQHTGSSSSSQHYFRNRAGDLSTHDYTLNIDVTLLTTSIDADEDVFLWYLDMRYRSAAYTKVVGQYEVSRRRVWDLTRTSSGAGEVPLPDELATGPLTVTNAVTNIETYQTRILFYGELVDSMDGVSNTSTAPGPVVTTISNAEHKAYWGWHAAASNPTGTSYYSPAGSTATPAAPSPTPSLVNGGYKNDGSFRATEAYALVDYPANPSDAPGTNMELSGSLTPGSVKTYHTSTAWPLYNNLRAIYRTQTVDPKIFWARTAPDREGVPSYLNQGFVGNGTWIAHKGHWAFSMAALEGPTVTDRQWRSKIKGAEFAAVTGAREPPPELYISLWPLSACVVQKPS